jgi:hypothetical protein
MTLEQAMNAGYQFTSHGGTDPAPEVAKAIPRAEIVAEIARIAPLLARDHISCVRTMFLTRVLSLTPPP